MHSDQSAGGTTFGKNVTFLGRSGIKILKGGLRVAFISGIDSDLLGPEIKRADPGESYLGNLFVEKDMERLCEEYRALVTESGRQGVDILMTGQWPLNISGSLSDPSIDVD